MPLWRQELGVRAVIVKSFARIHEQFKETRYVRINIANEADYDLIKEDDTFNFVDLAGFSPGKQLTLEVVHADGIVDIVFLNHTYNAQQLIGLKQDLH